MAERQNELDGRTWTRYSISIWDDLRKTPEEVELRHPALFPRELVDRLIEIFTHQEGELVLDPFCGSGTVPLAAVQRNCNSIGVDLSSDYIQLAASRLRELAGTVEPEPNVFEHQDDSGNVRARLVQADARYLLRFVVPETVDLCVTSPPYWNILRQRRSADRKTIQHYGNDDLDLGNIDEYTGFLDSLQDVLAQVFVTLKPGSMCCVVVMDLRKKNRFFPLHNDVMMRAKSVGFTLDDIIIWDRRQEYNNLRPLGYPWVFRVNKVHEFVLLFQKRV